MDWSPKKAEREQAVLRNFSEALAHLSGKSTRVIPTDLSTDDTDGVIEHDGVVIRVELAGYVAHDKRIQLHAKDVDFRRFLAQNLNEHPFGCICDIHLWYKESWEGDEVPRHRRIHLVAIQKRQNIADEMATLILQLADMPTQSQHLQLDASGMLRRGMTQCREHFQRIHLNRTGQTGYISSNFSGGSFNLDTKALRQTVRRHLESSIKHVDRANGQPWWFLVHADEDQVDRTIPEMLLPEAVKIVRDEAEQQKHTFDRVYLAWKTGYREAAEIRCVWERDSGLH